MYMYIASFHAIERHFAGIGQPAVEAVPLRFFVTKTVTYFPMTLADVNTD